MNSNKKLKKTDLSITVILVIGILIVVNFFSYQIFTRWDLTQNKIYSISKVSRNTVRNLDDIVNIEVYFSENLPHQILAVKQEVVDVLDEYVNYSNGNIRVEYLSPGTDEQTMQEMYMKGITPLTFQVVEKDKMQVVNGYMGLIINKGTNSEIIPAVKQDVSDLEYQITSAIKKVAEGKVVSVAFLSSNGTTKQDLLQVVSEKLREIYNVSEVSLAEEDSTLDGIDTLIITGATEEFTEEQFKKIDEFLVRGGDLIVLNDGVVVDTAQGLMARKNDSNINELLTKYGVSIGSDFVLDTRSGSISFTQNNFPFPLTVKYPFWPEITKDGFNQDYSAVASLENIVLPWVSSVNVDTAKISEGNFSYIVSASANSWLMQDNFDLNPNQKFAPSGQKENHLAVVVNRGLKRAYNDNEESEDVLGRLIVIGDSEFMMDGFLQNSPDNLTFFQNIVDSLSLGDDLINIRSKTIVSRPINDGEELEDAQRNSIRFFNIFGVTILVVGFGLMRYYMRRKGSFADDL